MRGQAIPDLEWQVVKAIRKGFDNAPMIRKRCERKMRMELTYSTICNVLRRLEKSNRIVVDKFKRPFVYTVKGER